MKVRQENGRSLVSFWIYNERNELLAALEDNELRFRLSTWDVEYVGGTITCRSGRKKVLLKIDMSKTGSIKIHRGVFWCNGIKVEITKDKLWIGPRKPGTYVCNCFISDCNIGIRAGELVENPAGAGLYFKDVPRKQFKGHRIKPILRHHGLAIDGNALLTLQYSCKVNGLRFGPNAQKHPEIGYYEAWPSVFWRMA